MKKIPEFLLIIIICLLNLNDDLNACTTFCLQNKDQVVFGRNFDFPTGYGHVIVNKRNVVKTAFIQPPEKPIEWTSKFGSITFNQAGKEFPYGGINEKGLVVEQMWLQDSQYPEIDNRYGLSELQWIQYQLDNSATLNEVLASDTLVRVSKLSVAPLHFLVCDKEGHVATIEYIDGKMSCHMGSSLPYPVLANDSYGKSLEYLQQCKSFDGSQTMSFTQSSFDRFTEAAKMVKNYKNDQNLIDYSFSILDSVSQTPGTQWSIVYDITNMAVSYKTSSNNTIRKFKVNDFDFSCHTPSIFTDIDENMNNNKLLFLTYSTKTNRELIDKVFDNVEFLKQIPAVVREQSASYPESLTCNE